MERDATLLQVSDFMNKRVVSLPADMDIDAALHKLNKAGYSGAPVVEDGKVVGVLSELDCTRVLASAAFHRMPVGHVHDHMTRDVDSVTPDTDVFTVAQLFLNSGHRRLPVCDADGALIGLVALRDLGKALYSMQQQRDAVHSDRTPAGAAWDPEQSEERDRKS